MKILVLGASRGAGLACVSAAVARGHTVTAVSCSSLSKVLPSSTEGVSVRHIDATDAPSLVSILSGHDAVLVCVGSALPWWRALFARNDTRERVTRAVVSAAASVSSSSPGGIDYSTPNTTGGPRLVVLSSLGAGASRAALPWLLRLILARALGDHTRQEAAVQAGGVTYTILRAPQLTDAPKNGREVVVGDGRPPKMSVSRADVAEAMLNALEGPELLNKVASVCSLPA